MALLTASNVGQSFGDFDVFSGVTVSIPKGGKIGLVGPNGIGKTTLLLIMAGKQQPSSGSVHIARGTRVGYLSQESSEAFVGHENSVFEEMLTVFDPLRATEARLREMEAQMASDREHSDELMDAYSHLQIEYELAGGYEYETRIRQVLSGLGFQSDAWSQPLSQLSGGQKTRALLARLLLEAPDLLILDEPTNHLDVEAVQWLEGTLSTWPGAVLVVSHDRYFLDRFADTIWEMSRQGMETFRGNYSAYLQQRQDRWERRQREYDALQERIAKEMDFIRRNIAGQRTQMAWGKLSRLSREVEAIRVGGLGAIGDLESKGWSQVAAELDLRRPASTLAELQEAINALPAPTRPPVVNVRLRSAYRSGNLILRASDLVVGYPGRPLFSVDALELWRQEIAALIGPNGTGKTTFLRTLLGQIEPLEGEIQLGASLKVGYFAQTQESLDPNQTVLDEFLRHKAMPISEARNILARYLFRGDDVYSKVGSLSGGQRARLALAILVLQEANFLLLDEPTNHLDIPSQEVLQAALEAFDGTVLLVSHDRYLVDRLASQVWELKPGDGRLRLEVFPGPYQEYLAARSAPAQPVAVAAPVEQLAAANGGPRLSKNEQRRRAEALAAVEAEVAATEARASELAEAMQAAATAQDFTRLQQLNAEYEAAEARVVALLEQWEALAHEPGDHRTDG